MSADLTPLRNSVVRISGPEGSYAGLGYRISADIVVTCAHVVAEALNHDADAEEPPIGQVLVDAPFALGEDARTPIEASVVPKGWLPVREGNAPADLAVLRLPLRFPWPVLRRYWMQDCPSPATPSGRMAVPRDTAATWCLLKAGSET